MGPDVDIGIVGAGPVGMALALLLVRRGIAPASIAVVDGKSAEVAAQDPRSLALSFGSRQILEEAGAWPVACDPIHQVHVSRRGHFGRTLIDRKDVDLPALGYVTRYGVLIRALAAAASNAGISVLRPVQLRSANERDDRVELRFEDEGVLTAAICVQAEGGLFSEQAAKSLQRDYGQVAVVSEVKVDAPLAGRAFERFTDEGPLALLPQDGGYALVWCVRPDTANVLLALPDNEFLKRLQQVFGSRLGRFTAVAARSSYPLGLNARPATSARTAAIGNAAQTLHPVAGQGLNLGLRDAAVLARLLSEEISPAALGRFASRRNADRSLTIRLTDAMARLFSSAPDGALSQSLLGMSLGFIDAVDPARRLFAEQMMFGRR